MINLSNQKTRISFYTLGCRLNQSETAVIETGFVQEGYHIVPFTEQADIVVINTCTVTENGDADTRRLVNKATRINPQARIALVGCQAQVQKEQLLQLPNVQWVVGNQLKLTLHDIVRDYERQSQPQVFAPTITRDPFVIPTPGLSEHRTRANIKIQDGCDFFCSFCEIPYARGRARSRVFEDILVEARALVAAGHRELVVTGINVGTYSYRSYRFVDVIAALEDIQGLERIRISSIEPTTIPMTIFKRMKKESKLCRHLHIPLQSGSNTILSAMKRKYTREEFTAFISSATDMVDELCVGTDIIVGYPGEGETEFQQTAELVRDLPIHYFHVFSYSERQYARSRHASVPVPAAEIRKRSQVLRDLGRRKRAAFHQSLLGSTQSVLFEQERDGYFCGLTDNYVRVHTATKRNVVNHLCKLRLNGLDADKLYGIIEEI